MNAWGPKIRIARVESWGCRSEYHIPRITLHIPNNFTFGNVGSIAFIGEIEQSIDQSPSRGILRGNIEGVGEGYATEILREVGDICVQYLRHYLRWIVCAEAPDCAESDVGVELNEWCSRKPQPMDLARICRDAPRGHRKGRVCQGVGPKSDKNCGYPLPPAVCSSFSDCEQAFSLLPTLRSTIPASSQVWIQTLSSCALLQGVSLSLPRPTRYISSSWIPPSGMTLINPIEPHWVTAYYPHGHTLLRPIGYDKLEVEASLSD